MFGRRYRGIDASSLAGNGETIPSELQGMRMIHTLSSRTMGKGLYSDDDSGCYALWRDNFETGCPIRESFAWLSDFLRVVETAVNDDY